ncbi:MAG TPA: VWA domain-containing protein [Chitinophagaceae bacterium]|nr:VWA domain-containing protein [Chitinophagaceae bacterium]
MDISFEHPEFWSGLLILIPLVVLFVFVLHRKAKTKKKLGDAHLISSLTKNFSPRLYNLKFILVLLALAASIIAAVNIRKPSKDAGENTAGIDVMFALDVSKSMLSTDIKPNRLERAKQLISMLSDKMGNNRTGLVIFAGQAYLQMPLTTDVLETKLFISNASPEAIPVQGTIISNALQLCYKSLDTKERSHKAVVLITDGEDHDEHAEAVAKDLYENGTVVFTVGIGTAEGSPIIEPGTAAYKTDETGKTIISKLNEDELQKIATITGGNYFHLDNVQKTAAEISTALNSMEKKLITGYNGEVNFFSFSPFIIAMAVLFLVIEVFIPEKIKTDLQ